MTQRMKVRKSTDGWRWTLWSGSDVIGNSTEGYENKGHAIRMAKSVAPDAELEIEDCEDDDV